MATALGQLLIARAAATISLDSLANVTYVAATAIDLHALVGSAALPLDVIFELAVTPGTVSGNKQALLFAKISMDGTNYGTGPESGTTVTDQPVLHFIGALPLPTSSTLQRKGFSLVAAIGFVPYSIKPIVFNDSGAAFASSGHALHYTAPYGDAR